MVAVSMCEEHCVKPVHTVSQHLLTEIGAGVNNDMLIVNFKQYRSTQSLVAKVEGLADLTGAPNDGHSL